MGSFTPWFVFGKIIQVKEDGNETESESSESREGVIRGVFTREFFFFKRDVLFRSETSTVRG